MLGVGQVLASGLEQQAAGSSTGGAGQAAGGTSPQLLRVMLVQRLGVCGNGVCEVGERQLLNSEGEVLQEAETPCAQVWALLTWPCLLSLAAFRNWHGCSYSQQGTSSCGAGLNGPSKIGLLPITGVAVVELPSAGNLRLQQPDKGVAVL
jgi:hypothetical protein